MTQAMFVYWGSVYSQNVHAYVTSNYMHNVSQFITAGVISTFEISRVSIIMLPAIVVCYENEEDKESPIYIVSFFGSKCCVNVVFGVLRINRYPIVGIQ